MLVYLETYSDVYSSEAKFEGAPLVSKSGLLAWWEAHEVLLASRWAVDNRSAKLNGKVIIKMAFQRLS